MVTLWVEHSGPTSAGFVGQDCPTHTDPQVTFVQCHTLYCGASSERVSLKNQQIQG